MNGKELGRRIKEDDRIKETILIMLTSFGKRGDGPQLKSMGFTGYLAKPIRRDQLHDCLTLALKRDREKPAETARSLITRHTLSEEKRKQVRLLVVDDNVTNQTFAKIILKKMGFASQAVDNGSEAVQAVREFKWDLVIMDCQMPVMDGYEATRLIRKGEAGEKNKHIPIIAMTAQAMKGDKNRCLEAGMNDYLTKPVKPVELNLLLEKWISHLQPK